MGGKKRKKNLRSKIVWGGPLWFVQVGNYHVNITLTIISHCLNITEEIYP